MLLQELNHWWTEKHVKRELLPEMRRELFHDVKKDLARKQVQVIIGLRRVGKSTLLFQIISDLIEKGLNPLHVVYCSFDEPELQSLRIEGILKSYSDLTGIDYKKEQIYLCIDEAQKSPHWTSDIKLIYDNFQNIKIIISGSASLNLLSEAKESLAGRAIYYELKPLHFREFLNLKGVYIEKPSLYQELLKREFDNFMLRPLPELIREKDISFIKSYIRNAIIEPILFKDIPKEFGESDILLLEKLLEIFLSSPGQYLSLDELAKDLKRTKTTLYEALFYLECSFLVKRVLNYRPSIRAVSRKLSRIYAYHPGLTLPYNASQEKFAENLVLFELDAKHYWREKEKEIDFLKDSTLVEVKLKSKIGKDDLRWIRYFLKKYGEKLPVKKAYILTKDVEEKIGDICLIPLWKFCYEGL